LTYKEQRQVEVLPGIIKSLETEEFELQARMAQPDFYKVPATSIRDVLARLEEVRAELPEKYERYYEMEARRA
jgi:ABC transport system ATP-binding/permease protein